MVSADEIAACLQLKQYNEARRLLNSSGWEVRRDGKQWYYTPPGVLHPVHRINFFDSLRLVADALARREEWRQATTKGERRKKIQRPVIVTMDVTLRSRDPVLPIGRKVDLDRRPTDREKPVANETHPLSGLANFQYFCAHVGQATI